MNVPEVVARNCRYGRMWVPVKDQYIGRSLDFYGEYSEAEVLLFKQIVKPGMWVLDVGANIGAFTLPLSKFVGDQGRVIAFEPQPEIFSILEANCKQNKVSNAVLYNAAVGSTNGKARIPFIDYSKEKNLGGVEMADFGIEVPKITLDSLNLPACHFIKIDVEGMEAHVIRGAKDLLTKFRPILHVENDRVEKSKELITLIESFDYNLWWHTPPMFNPHNYAGETHDLWPGLGSCNMICVPKGFNVDLGDFDSVDGPDDLPEFMK